MISGKHLHSNTSDPVQASSKVNVKFNYIVQGTIFSWKLQN